jgi:hypothetical protein
MGARHASVFGFAVALLSAAARRSATSTRSTRSPRSLASSTIACRSASLPFVLAGGSASAGGPLRSGRLLDFGGRRYSDLLGTIARAMGDQAVSTYGQGGQGLLPGVLA